MVVHLTRDGYSEDGKEPISNIPIGLHWVYFDTARWQGDEEYQTRMRRLYRVQAPALIYGRTPVDIDLDLLRDDGLLTVAAAPGIIGDHRDSIRHLLISNTKQTGDVPHIAAAMVHDSMLDVLIVHTPQTKPGALEMKAVYEHAVRNTPASSPKQPYTSLRDGGARVRLLEEPADTRYHWYNALMPDDAEYGPLGPPLWRSKASGDDHIYTYERGDGARVEYKMMRVGGATSLVAAAYGFWGADLFLAANTQALRSDAVRDHDVEAFLAKAYGLDLTAPRRRYLLVWSRYSGRRPGGYNPAGDSSVAGNQQLVDLAAKLDRIPITVGHNPPSGRETPHGKIHLGEFWNNTDPSNPFTGQGRAGQTSFYALFHARHDVIQVGQKTGGMDNAALVGMRTVYIEDVRSPQQHRMTKWSQVMAHYRGAAIAQPPKRLGKALRDVTSMPGAPQLTIRDDGQDFVSVRKLREAYEKGYSGEDLQIIEAELRKL